MGKNKSCCFVLPEHYAKKHQGIRCSNKEKKVLERAIVDLIELQGVDRFLTDMSLGTATDAAEIVLKLKEKYPVTLECVIPYEEQAASWNEKDRDRYYFIIEQCDRETMLQTRCTEDCMERCRRYMEDRADSCLMYKISWRVPTYDTEKSCNLTKTVV